jgi:pimeloyl-ACP methyl ester carboxylesterase
MKKNKTRMQTCQIAIYVSFMSVFLFCQAHESDYHITPESIADAFINPSSNFADSLASAKAPVDKWNSNVAEAVKTGMGATGNFTQVLTDSSGVGYTLGWKTPANIRPDTTYPLVIYLHGGTGSPLTTKGEKAYDMLTPLSDTFQLFLASPSANRFAPWWSPEGTNRILQTLRYMSLHYPVNPDKVFLAGVSDGATGSYGIANTACHPFAGFIAVSGFGGMLQSVAMPLVPGNIRQRPIYNVNAGKDRIYDIAQVNMFLDWLGSNGVNVIRKVYPDELHGFDYRDKEFGTIASFIRNWTKPQANINIDWTFVPGFINCVDNVISCKFDDKAAVRHISAIWSNDTLSITSEGIKEIILTFPGIDKDWILVKKNNKPARKIKAFPATPLLAYLCMLHECNPNAKLTKCYKINF